MTREEIKKNKLYIQEEFRLSHNQTSNNKKKKWFITINCNKCGENVTKTYQKNSWHFTCGKCVRGRKTPEQFITECKQTHQHDKYDYTKTEYVNNSTNVVIICKKHGNFYPKPTDFLAGTKCPVCAVETRAQVIPERLRNTRATLYLVKFSETLYKLGVTVQSIHSRLISCLHPYEVVAEFTSTYDHVCSIEKRLKEDNNHIQVTVDPSFVNGGRHEFFTQPLYIKEIHDTNKETAQTRCLVPSNRSGDMDSTAP